MLDFLSKRKKLIFGGLGFLAVGTFAMMWRRRRAAAAANAGNKKATMGGLVVHPVGELWGTRPLTLWQPRQATVVPVTFRGTGTLAALAIVWEGVRAADVTGALALLADGHPAVASYNIDSKKELTAQATGGVNNNNKTSSNKTNADNWGIFTHVFSAAGSMTSSANATTGAGGEGLLSYLAVLPADPSCLLKESEPLTIVELVICATAITSEDVRRQLCRAVECNPVVPTRVAQLVATVPQSSCRVIVSSASSFTLATTAQSQQPPVMSLSYNNSSNGSKQDRTAAASFPPLLSLILDGTVSKQMASDAADGLTTRKSLKQQLFKIEQLSEADVIHTPRCGVTLRHPVLGVDLLFQPDTYTLYEPRFGATNSMAIVVAGQQKTAPASSSSAALLSFELWSDAPEHWFNGSQCDDQFRVEVGALLLPQGRESEVAAPKLMSVCAHEKCAVMQTAADGRSCYFVIFRRGPIQRVDVAPGAAGADSNANKKRELVILKFEGDTFASNPTLADMFQKILDSINVRV